MNHENHTRFACFSIKLDDSRILYRFSLIRFCPCDLTEIQSRSQVAGQSYPIFTILQKITISKYIFIQNQTQTGGIIKRPLIAQSSHWSPLI